MSQERSTDVQEDVVDLLLAQHAQIREQFARVMGTPVGQAEPLNELVHLLSVHETAEEEIVHPLARGAVPDGDAVVDDRLAEEREAKELLARLDGMATDDPELPPLLNRLQDAVLRHAQQEEEHEFTWLRQNCEASELRAAGTAVRAAQAVAPTRPHPGAETAVANVIVGPVAAVMDRVRDAVRAARGGEGR